MRSDAQPLALSANASRWCLSELADLAVGEAQLLGLAQGGLVEWRRLLLQLAVHPDDWLDGVEEPGVDSRELVNALHRHPALQRLGHGEDAQRRSVGERILQLVELEGLRVQPPHSNVQHAQRPLDDLWESTPDGHHLAHALHLGADAHGGAAELG